MDGVGSLTNFPTEGTFSKLEIEDHMNVKELKAALFCLEALAKNVKKYSHKNPK